MKGFIGFLLALVGTVVIVGYVLQVIVESTVRMLGGN